MAERPLEGIKVIDVSRVLAGPYATMLLADMGAEVIKIERPGQGDDSRSFGPFVNGKSAYFMSVNRGKKSVVLNLKDPEDRERFKALVKQADVLVENFRPGAMERLGLDYEKLSVLNPRLIYAACSGFGQQGPYRLKPAYDIIIQAMSGLMSITGPGPGQPTRVGTSIADLVAALFTVIGILAALNERNRTGRGQMVDVAMLDCQLALLENALARYFATGEDPVPLGNRHPSIAPFSSFNAADGQFVLAVGNNSLWEAFCNAVGQPALLEDPRFADNASRTTHWAELHQILEELFRTKTVAEWLELLDSHGIPCGPINTISAVAGDPHVQERGMVVELVDEEAGPVKMAGLPIKFSRSSCTIDKPAPRLGAHTEEVLSSLDRHGHNTDKT